MVQGSLSKAARQEIDEVLASFGLDAKERDAYLALLRSGRMTVTPLARTLGLPVTTIQSVLGRLEKTGLVRVTARKSRHAYEAHDPSVLKKILERRTQEAAAIVPLLQKIRREAVGSAPKMRFYYRERMADIFHEALAAKGKVVHEIVAAKDLQDILGEKFHFTRRRMERGVRLRSLRVEAREIKKYSAATHVRELREAKFLPRELDFRASVMFWDDTVAFFTTKEEGMAWTVESPVLRQTEEQLFELLWSVSRRMETA